MLAVARRRTESLFVSELFERCPTGCPPGADVYATVNGVALEHDNLKHFLRLPHWFCGSTKQAEPIRVKYCGAAALHALQI